ncbi:MAG: GAF domain-containing sensor histidine kinase [Chloroflexi bacterium]|nr:MAG: GAF domain-containing sensor histidine kinase [Chloroflexota bacterium]
MSALDRIRTVEEEVPVRGVVEPDRALDIRTVLPRRDRTRALALAELSTKLAESITEVDDVIDSVVQLISSFLGDTAVLRLLDPDGTRMRVVAAHDADPVAAGVMRSALEDAPQDMAHLVPHNLVVRDARPVLLTGDALVAATGVMPEASREALTVLGVHTALVCPLRAQGRVIGTLGLWRRGDAPVHSERDQSFAQELADRAALAIENARLVASLREELAERKRNEDTLRLSNELLQRAQLKQNALVEHLVNAQEEERRRIAIDVHDDSIQAMAAIGVRLQVLRRHASDHDLAERIAAIEDAVTESIARLRNLLFHLESSSLDKQGLARTLTRSMAETFPDSIPKTRVRNRLTQEPIGHIRVVAYRIAQEALSNVRKHARASEVTVTLSQEDQGLLVTVQDDGKGFRPSDALERSLPGHLGLRAMEERAHIAGGWLRVESTPDQGTRVTFWLPYVEAVQLDG